MVCLGVGGGGCKLLVFLSPTEITILITVLSKPPLYEIVQSSLPRVSSSSVHFRLLFCSQQTPSLPNYTITITITIITTIIIFTPIMLYAQTYRSTPVSSNWFYMLTFLLWKCSRESVAAPLAHCKAEEVVP